MVKTITVTGTCAGGGHIFIEIDENGRKRNVVLEKEEIMKDEILARDEQEAISRALGRQVRKEAESERLNKLLLISGLPLE